MKFDALGEEKGRSPRDWLSRGDANRLLEALELLYRPVEAHAFPDHAVRVLSALFPDMLIAANLIETDTGRVTTSLPSSIANPAEVVRTIGQHIMENPLARHLAGGGAGGLLDLDDFCSRPEFHRTRLFQEVFREFDTDSQVSLTLENPSVIGAISMHRFGLGARIEQRHRQLGLAVRPHLLAAFANARLFSSLRAPSPAIDAGKMARRGLTLRETEVLHWMAEGKRDGEIATILSIGERTVHTHVAKILAKLGAETRTAAVTSALRDGVA